jgi:PEP-CTERM motif
MKNLLLCTLLALGLIGRVSAQIITFDDLALPSSGSGTLSGGIITNGYSGLNWNNFGYQNGNLYFANPSGYQNGVISQSNVAFNPFGSNSSISSYSRFDFNSAYFTAAWQDGLTITINGLNNGNQIYSRAFTVSTQTPQFEVFNWSNLTELDFSSSGGVPHSGFSRFGTEFVMDNLSVSPQSVPEPSIYALFGIGAIGMLMVMLRKKAA